MTPGQLLGDPRLFIPSPNVSAVCDESNPAAAAQLLTFLQQAQNASGAAKTTSVKLTDVGDILGADLLNPDANSTIPGITRFATLEGCELSNSDGTSNGNGNGSDEFVFDTNATASELIANGSVPAFKKRTFVVTNLMKPPRKEDLLLQPDDNVILRLPCSGLGRCSPNIFGYYSREPDCKKPATSVSQFYGSGGNFFDLHELNLRLDLRRLYGYYYVCLAEDALGPLFGYTVEEAGADDLPSASDRVAQPSLPPLHYLGGNWTVTGRTCLLYSADMICLQWSESGDGVTYSVFFVIFFFGGGS